MNNAYVNADSKIFVTLTASTTGSWYLSDKQAGSFKLVLSQAQPSDVSFDYFIVQTEGQIATSTPAALSPSGPSGAAPVITVLGDNPLHLDIGDVFADPGVTVADAADGTDPVVTYINGVQQAVSSTTIDTSQSTTYIITYSATDQAGNHSTAERSVVVGNPNGTPPGGGSGSPTPTDTTPPVVTLSGAAAMQLSVGDTWTDPGATALDDTDGDLTAHILETGAVDTATPGLYTLTYSATDAAGNTGSASRVVTVVSGN